MPPSQLREHVDQLVQALHPFLPRFSSSFSVASECEWPPENHAWPPNVLLPCTFSNLMRLCCCWWWWCWCWCCLCILWCRWCWCWCSLVCRSCADAMVEKIHNKMPYKMEINEKAKCVKLEQLIENTFSLQFFERNIKKMPFDVSELNFCNWTFHILWHFQKIYARIDIECVNPGISNDKMNDKAYAKLLFKSIDLNCLLLSQNGRC